MKKMQLAGLALATTLLTACTTEELEAISAGLAQGLAEAQYNSAYSPYGYNNTSGTWVGYNQCQYTGSFYQCDTNNDGWADSFGDASDGSYTSSSLKINGKGEGFTRGENGEWERNRAYDTSDRDDDHGHGHHHDRDD